MVSGDAGHQSFVDLGCGNGLLVYLLTEEGVSYASLFVMFRPRRERVN